MYESKTLANGVRVLTEAMPGMRSAAIGIFIGTGSRDESAAESGSAHFIEHMLFKGTCRRTAAQLAVEMDSMGGQVNAYTTKESTCYYARILDKNLAQAIDVLWDMLFCSKFDESDVATERGVILEEIGMYEDNPEDLCSERLAAAVYKGSALARPILGKKTTLAAMTGESLRAYHKAHYRPGSIVVALAGSFTRENVDDIVRRFETAEPQPEVARKPAVYRPAITVKKRTIEQNHITIAYPGLPHGDKDRFGLQILSFLLGGGMSSRLWQEVREKQGLCYSIYSYGISHEDTGMFALYTALGREQEGQALKTIFDVVADFVATGVSGEALNMAREQSKANVLMGMESTQARMSHLGRSALLGDKIMIHEEIVEAYDLVTTEQIQALARRILAGSNVSISAVGRVGSAEAYTTVAER